MKLSRLLIGFILTVCTHVALCEGTNEMAAREQAINSFFGMGCKQNYTNALEISRRLGFDPVAMFIIGFCFETGEGGQGQDIQTSMEYYAFAVSSLEKSKEELTPVEEYVIGFCYSGGRGVEINESKAFEYLLKASDKGLPAAQGHLGFVYENGIGVGTNIAEAVRWTRQAAENGDLVSQVRLSDYYKDGVGVKQNFSEGLKWCRKAAEQGNVFSQAILAVTYYQGNGVDKDLNEAVKWFRMAAENGHPFSQFMLGSFYDMDLGDDVEDNPEEAVKWWRRAAEQGEATAQYSLAKALADGDGVQKDKEEAMKWLRESALQGEPMAQLSLGKIYAKGEDVPKDEIKAAKWFQKAAEQGNADAQLYIGVFYAGGIGVEKNEPVGYAWLRKAAEQGNTDALDLLGVNDGIAVPVDESARLTQEKLVAAEKGDPAAQFEVALCYLRGLGVEKDWSQGIQWMRKAAELNDKTAQVMLSGFFMSGIGVERAPKEGLFWREKAAENGDATSQLVVGNYYWEGDGTEKSPVRAVKWWQRAAEQGNAQAHLALAKAFRGGVGVVQDDIKACFHCMLASALGHDMAKSCLPFLRDEVSPASYLAAQKMAARWMDEYAAGQTKSEKTKEDVNPKIPEQAVTAIGSGFLISADGYFLTCAHVLEGGNSYTVVINQEEHEAVLVKADLINDVALLKLEGAGFSPLSLSKCFPKMGDKVFTVGYPNLDIQGSAAKYTEGTISSLSGIQDDIRTMQITVPVQSGNSGGPLVDAMGNVIGLVLAQINAASVLKHTGAIPQNVNFAVKINYAFPLIQSVHGLPSRLPSPCLKAPENHIEVVKSATGILLVGSKQ